MNQQSREGIINALTVLSMELFLTHVDKGWTKNANPDDLNWRGNQLMLIVGELSEGHEGLRKDLMDDKLPHRKMIEVELADAIIRILNFGSQCGMDIPGALIEKAEFNKTREYMHGGKKF